MSDLIPGSPYYREGYQLSARELQDTDDLARAASRATFTGDGAGTAGYGGFSFTVAPEQEIIIMITGQETDEATYSWCAARRKVGYPNEWELDPDGPASVYTEIPAHEINNNKTVPLLKVVRAWVSNQDGGMSLDFSYQASGGGSINVSGFDIDGFLDGYTAITDLYFIDDAIYIIPSTPDSQPIVRLRDASTTQRGVVTTATQIFGGMKGFADLVTMNKAHHSGNALEIEGPGSSPAVNVGLNPQYTTGNPFENPVQSHGFTLRGYNPSISGNFVQFAAATYLQYATVQVWEGIAGMTATFDHLGLDISAIGGQINNVKYRCRGQNGQTGTNGSTQFTGGIWTGGPCPGSGGGLADGTYGDLIISGGGTVFTVGNLAITTSKIANGAVTPPKASGGLKAMMAAYGG